MRLLRACLLFSPGLAAFLAHRGALGLFFVGNDTLSLIETARIAGPADLVRVFSQRLMEGTTFGGHFFRPVSTLSYSLDRTIWGLNPLGYHLTDVLLHVTLVLLLGLLVGRLFRSHLAGWAAGMFVAIHPAGYEVVTLPSCRQDTLGALFSLATLLLVLRVEETPKRARLFRGLAVASFALALGAKEIALVLVPVLLVGSCAGATGHWRLRTAAAARWTFPFLAAAVVFLAWRWAVLHGPGGYDAPPQNRPSPLEVGWQLAGELRLLPHGLALGWASPHPSPAEWSLRILAALAALAGVGAAWRAVLAEVRRLPGSRRLPALAGGAAGSLGLLAVLLLAAGAPLFLAWLEWGWGNRFDSGAPALFRDHLDRLPFDHFQRLTEPALAIGYVLLALGGTVLALALRPDLPHRLLRGERARGLLVLGVWLLGTALVYAVSRKMVARYAYFALVPLAGMAGGMLSGGLAAAARVLRPKSLPDPWPARLTAGALAAWLPLVSAPVAGAVCASPLFTHYPRYESDSRLLRLLLPPLTELADRLPEGSTLRLHRVPRRTAVASREGSPTAFVQRSVSGSSARALTSWLRLTRPGKRITVEITSDSRERFPAGGFEYVPVRGAVDSGQWTVDSGQWTVGRWPSVGGRPSSVVRNGYG